MAALGEEEESAIPTARPIGGRLLDAVGEEAAARLAPSAAPESSIQGHLEVLHHHHRDMPSSDRGMESLLMTSSGIVLTGARAAPLLRMPLPSASSSGGKRKPIHELTLVVEAVAAQMVRAKGSLGSLGRYERRSDGPNTNVVERSKRSSRGSPPAFENRAPPPQIEPAANRIDAGKEAAGSSHAAGKSTRGCGAPPPRLLRLHAGLEELRFYASLEDPGKANGRGRRREKPLVSLRMHMPPCPSEKAHRDATTVERFPLHFADVVAYRDYSLHIGIRRRLEHNLSQTLGL
jgi:hypothetical protein